MIEQVERGGGWARKNKGKGEGMMWLTQAKNRQTTSSQIQERWYASVRTQQTEWKCKGHSRVNGSAKDTW